MVQKKIIGILGILLILSALILQDDKANDITFLIVGIISAIAGLTLSVKKQSEGWTVAILGLWLIVSAFIPFIDVFPCKYCNDLLIGTIFFAIGRPKINKDKNLITQHDYNNKIQAHK